MRESSGGNGRAQVPPPTDDAYWGNEGSPNVEVPTSKDGRTILLVDDHDVVRPGLRLLIETRLDYRVVEAASADEALAMVEGQPVDLVLLDARMPEHDGIWALRRLREAHPELPVLVLSTYDSEDYVESALEAGASGYVLKEATTAQLGEAIETALSNKGVYLYPAVAQRVLARSRRGGRGVEDTLSDREIEVLRLLSEGATNEEIAGRLFLSEKTVKSHLSSIFRKLEVTNRTQAAARAIRDRMVPLRGA
jgi:two-component system, NarL family, response regulator LiaR